MSLVKSHFKAGAVQRESKKKFYPHLLLAWGIWNRTIAQFSLLQIRRLNAYLN